MDFTVLTLRGDGWTEPDEQEILDEVYALDGIVVDFLDLNDEMQEKRSALIVKAKPIPYNFGPPDDYWDRE